MFKCFSRLLRATQSSFSNVPFALNRGFKAGMHAAIIPISFSRLLHVIVNGMILSRNEMSSHYNLKTTISTTISTESSPALKDAKQLERALAQTYIYNLTAGLFKTALRSVSIAGFSSFRGYTKCIDALIEKKAYNRPIPKRPLTPTLDTRLI